MSMRLLVVLSFLTLLSVSCSSKKAVNTADNMADSSLDKDGLLLNGDSDSGKAGGLKTVYFDYTSSSLNESNKKVLKSNAAFLKTRSSVSIAIEGHCDERGGRQFNLALGEKRAQAVKNYLVGLGVPKKRLSTISYGNEKPVVEGASEMEWSKNRRGNFVVTSM